MSNAIDQPADTGPTGCGKTEIARRLAKLANSPFVKVRDSCTSIIHSFCAVTMHGLVKVGSQLGGGRFPFGPEMVPS